MQRLTLEEWENVFNNMNDLEEDQKEEFGDWVEVLWLESTDEWVLAYEYEIFEDGFKTEKEAQERLTEMEQQSKNVN